MSNTYFFYEVAIGSAVVSFQMADDIRINLNEMCRVAVKYRTDGFMELEGNSVKRIAQIIQERRLEIIYTGGYCSSGDFWEADFDGLEEEERKEWLRERNVI
jgi:hypothetical protein